MEYIRLQVGCLTVLIYIMIVYYRDRQRFRLKRRITLFDLLLLMALVNLLLDAATTYAINHLNTVPLMLRRILVGTELLSANTLIFTLFVYLLHATDGLPKDWRKRIVICIPYYINVIVVLCYLPSLECRSGPMGNYAAGISVNCCFFMAGVYGLLIAGLICTRWNYIQRHKRLNIITGLAVLVIVNIHQAMMPDARITCIAAMMIVLGAYLNQEDPAILVLDRYHSEMVTGFANLIETRDESTGGHVKRTTGYVELLAKGLRRRGLYHDVLTKDYIRSLMMAAPMHDIGKISVPDTILQKPGKLTSEEFAQMQQHTVKGAEIIHQSFSRVGSRQYLQIAEEIAMHHHEKWNGKGYPHGLSGEKIPFCARIMAIADVFDAVSEDRCYRPALPLEECFDIIAKGSGQDFDPLLADMFLKLRPQVEEILKQHFRLQ